MKKRLLPLLCLLAWTAAEAKTPLRTAAEPAAAENRSSATEHAATGYVPAGYTATGYTAAEPGNGRRRTRTLKGSGRMETQQRGRAGNYHSLHVSRGIRVTVDPAASDILVTADDNVIDHVTVEGRDGDLRISIDADTERITEALCRRFIRPGSATAVVPASKRLETLRATASAQIVCKAPVGRHSAVLLASSGSSIEADVETSDLQLTLSGSSRFAGTVRTGTGTVAASSGSRIRTDLHCSGTGDIRLTSSSAFDGSVQTGGGQITLSSGSRFNAPVRSDGTLDIVATSSSRFEGPVSAPDTRLMLSSGAAFRGAIRTGSLDATASSSSRLDGAMTAERAELTATSGSAIRGEFSGERFEAQATSSARIELLGDARVSAGSVSASSGSRFDAPDLRVADYSINATSSSRAVVWCTRLLKARHSSGALIDYGGECRVEDANSGLRKRP